MRTQRRLSDEFDRLAQLVAQLPLDPREPEQRLRLGEPDEDVDVARLRLLTAGDVSVVAVREGFEGVCVSSKLYTAMAAGTPILYIAQPDSGEAKLIDVYECGVHLAQGDTDGVVEALRTWRENFELVDGHGPNAREALEVHYTKDELIEHYHRMLTGQLNSSRGSSNR